LDLHDAAKDGNFEQLERLIGIGCSVDELDHKRMTALAYASQSTKATTGVLRLLLDLGADPNLPVSEDRKYAVGLAASSGSIAKVQLLLDAGADIRYLSKEITRSLSIAFMGFMTAKIFPTCLSSFMSTEQIWMQSPTTANHRLAWLPALADLTL